MRLRRAAACVLIASAIGSPLRASDLFDAETLAFAEQLDNRALSLLAVQHQGRITILDTLARSRLAGICGAERVDGTAPAFGYLELYFNAGAYLERPVILVRSARLRKLLAPHIRPAAGQLHRTGRIAPISLLSSEATEHLIWTERASEADVRRVSAATSLRAVLGELGRRKQDRLLLERLEGRLEQFLAVGQLRLLPRRGQVWLGPDHVRALASERALSAGLTGGAGEMAARIEQLAAAWRRRDAATVNDLVPQIAGDGVRLAGGEYPAPVLRRIELVYNRTRGGTVVFAGFALALVVMMIATATGGRLHGFGLGVFGLSTAALVAGFAARWVLSGRSWYLPPITNQFEAVVASAMGAAVIALALELARPRGFLALAAALYAVICLLAGMILPQRMGAAISPAAGILNSPIMAAHVAVIIVGHAMVGITFFISAIYLIAAASGAAADRLQPVDRCNLIAAQVACWTLLAGTAIGAYWADEAWGRWWGWDAKETWALITCLMFVAIIHLRLVTSDRSRGTVTAVGCVLATGAMLFNWIVVNYLMPSLHSYA